MLKRPNSARYHWLISPLAKTMSPSCEAETISPSALQADIVLKLNQPWHSPICPSKGLKHAEFKEGPNTKALLSHVYLGAYSVSVIKGTPFGANTKDPWSGCSWPGLKFVNLLIQECKRLPLTIELTALP